ncbi:hypothetical protein MishRS11D_28450 [Methylomagnum ishizawai]|nr:hypothetical protein MishRS11D_28450 [Methylomagnum ishizawai]
MHHAAPTIGKKLDAAIAPAPWVILYIGVMPSTIGGNFPVEDAHMGTSLE